MISPQETSRTSPFSVWKKHSQAVPRRHVVLGEHVLHGGGAVEHVDGDGVVGGVGRGLVEGVRLEGQVRREPALLGGGVVGEHVTACREDGGILIASLYIY